MNTSWLGLAGLWLAATLSLGAVTTGPYWNWRNPLPHGNDFNSVAYGGGQFVAVGRGGCISVSPDGQTWTTAVSGVTVELTDVVYGNGCFVVASYALNGVLVSTDGRTWTRPAIPASVEWLRATHLAFGAGRFVVAGDIGYVASSSDGLTWTTGYSGTIARITDIAFGGDRFVGVLDSGGTVYSTDGLQWTAGGYTGIMDFTVHVAYGNGRWIALGAGHVATSVDSVTWTSSPANMKNDLGWTYDALTWFKGRFYAWGANLPLLSSEDGNMWRVYLPAPNPFFYPNSLAASADRIVAAGRFGGLRSSADGTTWVNHTVSTVQGDLRGAAYGAGRWLVAGTQGLASSTDAVTWQMLPSAAGYDGGTIAYGNGRFVAGASDGGIGFSLDGGATWTRGVTRPTALLRVVFGNGRFVATTNSQNWVNGVFYSELISSVDGVAWTPGFRLPGDTGAWRDIIFSDGAFLAIGTKGADEHTVVARSTDGVSWTLTAEFDRAAYAVGGRSGLYVVAGLIGDVWTSPDGVTWTHQGQPLMAAGAPSALTALGTRLVGSTFYGKIVTSDDGINWSTEDFSGSGMMWYIASGGDQVIAVGNAGAIWQTGAARFVGNSTRARVTAGSGTLIAGFVVTGSQSKTLLIRGVGPTLADYQVTDALATPTLQVFDNATGSLLATNRGWRTASDPAALVAAAKSVGAFALRDPGADSALLLTLPPGVYTAHVRSDTAATGVALVEVYEVGANASKVIAMSSRANVGTGADVLIPGLVITGDAPRRILARAVGPTLTQYGVDGVLARPVLTLLSGSTPLARNQGWDTAANAADVAEAARQVGGFPLPAGSADAALLVTVTPGVYTLHVSGANGTTGVALVEVYEVP